MSGLAAACVLAAALLVAGCVGGRELVVPTSAGLSHSTVSAGEVKSAIADDLREPRSAASQTRLEAVSSYYAKTGYAPIWIAGDKPSQKAVTAVEALVNAREHGLDPADYEAEALFQKVNTHSGQDLADLEVHLTRSMVAYAQHLNAGRVNPRQVSRETIVYPEALNVEAILSAIRKTGNIQVYLRLLAPHTPRYERLRLALADYKRIAADGGWPAVSKGGTLKPGATGPRVAQVRRRLAATGELSRERVNGQTYDAALEAAVKTFQARHGLAADGVIGPKTIEHMNVAVENRIATMVLNLERRRWMQNDYGRAYIFANLADQVIKLVRDEKTVHAELIQVGLPYHRTPVFHDEMEYVEINPYWNVPYSIAVNEYLPKLRSDPGILTKQNIKVLAGEQIVNASAVPWTSYSKENFPVRLRQDAGEGNALGRVKFMFPNEFNVYIHDTPSKSKFSASSRYFSHGCLRLRDPLKLAELLLGEQGWSRAKIDATVASGKRTVVPLKTRLPVHVTYLTAWVNKDGSVHFREDVYGRDPVLAAAMDSISGS